MAGIYFHIPFCRQACHYCDFHFSTTQKNHDLMVAAFQKELLKRQDYLPTKSIDTIYFGGGTPSVLPADDINRLIDTVSQLFDLSAEAEITMEANPDDLNPQKVKQLRCTAVNRFSIGIQSFFDEDLQWMNRAHTAAEAEASVANVQDMGYDNITLDLIYGFPLLTDEKWLANLRKVSNRGVPHVSAYSMTVEPQTALNAMIRKGSQRPMDETQSARQFTMMQQTLSAEGFEQYEISNFARNNRYARHNSNYWRGLPYLGIGPSAHSFNVESRQWNVAHNLKYMNALLQRDTIPFEMEILTPENQINETIMTSLRTRSGIDLKEFEAKFGIDALIRLQSAVKKIADKGRIIESPTAIRLTDEGMLFADQIAARLFCS